MRILALLMAICFAFPAFSQGLLSAPGSIHTPVSPQLKNDLLGSPVFIQIFKQERMLDLYAKVGDQYRLVNSFPICKFSGGLGPKRIQGDFKSPEGFYTVRNSQLRPDSHYYRAINLGFPNQFDRENGYNGNFLMIHGDCVSIGCYAMTNTGIDQIFKYATAALNNGQQEIEINIYPFRMTDENMRLHNNSMYISFWKQLKPGYDYFEKYHVPPTVSVVNAQYILNTIPGQSGAPAANPFQQQASKTFLALTKTK